MGQWLGNALNYEQDEDNSGKAESRECCAEDGQVEHLADQIVANIFEVGKWSDHITDSFILQHSQKHYIEEKQTLQLVNSIRHAETSYTYQPPLPYIFEKNNSRVERNCSNLAIGKVCMVCMYVWSHI